ncbi:MAG: SPOR domain-containing protein [Emcibacter sp.]|nr:SPOR domain-containing protein [Emcibacter sp.]
MSDEGEKSSWLEPLPGEYATEEDMTGRRMLVAALTVIVLAIFGGLIWYSYLEGNKGGPVPVVRADKSVTKIKPDTPGGLMVPDQDKSVFIKVTSGDAEKAENLAPSAELPVDLPIAKDTDAKSIEAAKEKADKADMASKQALLPPATESKPTAIKVAKTAVVIKKKRMITGGFLIQLGAFGKKGSAEQLWQKLQTNNTALLAELGADIMMVDLGKKGVLYRLRGGMIADRTQADNICRKLKIKKQACIVVTK